MSGIDSSRAVINGVDRQYNLVETDRSANIMYGLLMLDVGCCRTLPVLSKPFSDVRVHTLEVRLTIP